MQNISQKTNVLNFRQWLNAIPAVHQPQSYQLFKSINSLKDFGIFAGDLLLVEKMENWRDVEPHTLYAIYTHYYRLCVVKFEDDDRITLHNGYGEKSATYRRDELELIGVVVRIIGGGK